MNRIITIRLIEVLRISIDLIKTTLFIRWNYCTMLPILILCDSYHMTSQMFHMIGCFIQYVTRHCIWAKTRLIKTSIALAINPQTWKARLSSFSYFHTQTDTFLENFLKLSFSQMEQETPCQENNAWSKKSDIPAQSTDRTK